MTNIKENHNIEIPIYLGIDSLNFQNKLYTFKLFNIKKTTKTKVVALGGVSKKNIKKLRLINCFGFAGISYFK